MSGGGCFLPCPGQQAFSPLPLPSLFTPELELTPVATQAVLTLAAARA